MNELYKKIITSKSMDLIEKIVFHMLESTIDSGLNKNWWDESDTWLTRSLSAHWVPHIAIEVVISSEK